MALIILIISLLLSVFYLTLIVMYYIAWTRIALFNNNQPDSTQSFSILVPARNESATIINCLESIIAQKYPSENYEVIVINDKSTDETPRLVDHFIQQHPHVSISLLHTESHHVTGKKGAITLAIEYAQHPFIILTDADCTREPNWLATINRFVFVKQAKMVYAPVMFKAKTLFEKVQSLEFAGLVAIGGAAIHLKNPNMCSASNLIFEKKVFKEVGGYENNKNTATGDDEFLLHSVFKKYPDHIYFLKHPDAIVTTSANNTLAELAHQRKRWVSKSTKYDNRYITAILMAAYLYNASLVYYLLVNPSLGLILLLLKMVAEGLFLYNVLSFLGRKSTIILLPLAEPFHILYVLFIGLWGNMGSFTWKDRTVK